MDRIKKNKEQLKKRKRRTRAKIKGTSICPRLSVFRSNKHIYAQLIDDERGKTLIGLGDSVLKRDKKDNKKDVAQQLGRELAKKALANNIKEAIFDRGGYKYHGRVKAVAEGAKEAGLTL